MNKDPENESVSIKNLQEMGVSINNSIEPHQDEVFVEYIGAFRLQNLSVIDVFTSYYN